MYDLLSMPESEIRVVTMDVLALCRRVAGIWCRSFGVASPVAVDRLSGRIADSLGAEASDAEFEEHLHHLAKKEISRWFSKQGIPAESRDFDRVRHAFLMANAEGRLNFAFLDPDVIADSLKAALDRAQLIATPKISYRPMQRQAI